MKKLSKAILMLAFASLFILFLNGKVLAMQSSKIGVDNLYNNENLTGSNIVITGYALSESGVKQINVLVDNNIAGKAKIGLPRPDVSKNYPDYKDNDKSGFSFPFDISKIKNGNHQIKIQEVGNDNSEIDSLYSVNVVNPAKSGIVQSQEIAQSVYPNNSKLISRMYIDKPSDNDSVGSNVTVSGWALNASGIKQVNVLADGKSVGQANINLPRSDVDRKYPGYEGGMNSGFSCTFNAGNLSAGSHSFVIQAVGNDSSMQQVSERINIIKLQSRMYIDKPSDNDSVGSNVTVSGWALNASGIKQVNVLADGKSVGQANINLPRSDVDRKYPGYEGGMNSGFSCTFNAGNLSAGSHSFVIQAVGNDSSMQQVSENINIIKLAPKMCIDAPDSYSQITEKQFNVRGWSLDESGVKNVQISIDNGSLQNTSIGLLRVDVNRAYPEYEGGSNSGFKCDIDVSSLNSGIHTIHVKSIGENGSVITKDIPIYIGSNVLPSRIYVDAPYDGTSIKAQDNRVYIKGWSLNPFGVKQVQIYVDCSYYVNAQINLSRDDVNKLYPGYVGGAQSGFISSINLSYYSYGAHVITVKSIGNDGTIITKDIIIYKIYNNSDIASKLVSYLSSGTNIINTKAEAISLHDGINENTCVYFSSTALRAVGINVPLSMCNTGEYTNFLQSLGLIQDYNINSLYPGNICFSVNCGENYPTHTYVFIGWVDPFDHTIAYVADNQDDTVHKRSMIDAPGIDAFHYCFHD